MVCQAGGGVERLTVDCGPAWKLVNGDAFWISVTGSMRLWTSATCVSISLDELTL